MANPFYKRVLLKISGEALSGQQKWGFDRQTSAYIAQGIREICSLGIEISLVIGGGNLVRGAAQKEELGTSRMAADKMGMFATAINGLALQEALRAEGMDCCIQSALHCEGIFESYNAETAIQRLKNGQVLIFVGGMGHPYFTTDTAAALYALQTKAEIVLKGTKVSGVYSDDPQKNPSAKKIIHLTYLDALTQNLKVMDPTAFTLCWENKLPIYIFNLFEEGALKNAICGKKGGTLVSL